MKVWIVQNANDTIDGVFATEELARAFANPMDSVAEYETTGPAGKWTKEPPAKSGFYWIRRFHSSEPDIIEVFSPREGDLYFREFGEEMQVWLSSPGCQSSILGEFWSEPITPPEEQAQPEQLPSDPTQPRACSRSND